MPAPQLLSGLLENSFNRLLDLDPDSELRLASLKGKRLLIALQELPFDFLFVVSTQIDVLCVERDSPGSDIKSITEAADCYLATSLFTLPELRDISKLTQLIKTDRLQLEGDIQLAQQFSQLVSRLDIDWEEQLARYSGDVMAHEVFRIGRNLFDRVDSLRRSLETTVSEALREEKKLAANEPQVERFISDVAQLKSDTMRLEQKLKKLEQQ